jgi:HEAT repeat protein
LGAGATTAILAAAADADPELAADLYDLIADLGFGGGEVERTLRAALDHDDELVGAAAARALGAVGGAGGAEWLAGALADGSRPDVAAGAATGLGRLAGRGFADGSRAALHGSGLSSEEPEVRAAAALALAEARADDAATLELLAAQLTDDDPYPRLAAIRALGALGEAGRALLSARLAAEDDAEMADAIRAALGDEGPPA